MAQRPSIRRPLGLSAAAISVTVAVGVSMSVFAAVQRTAALHGFCGDMKLLGVADIRGS